MANKILKARVQNKCDTAANWKLATNFKPLKGEIILYTDTKQMKVGDGNTLVNNLPFYPSGDVTAAGNNTFTGSNVFTKNANFKDGVLIPSNTEPNKENVSITSKFVQVYARDDVSATWGFLYPDRITLNGSNYSTNYKSSSIGYNKGTSTTMTLNFPAVNSSQTTQTIATLEGAQTFSGTNTFKSGGIKIQNVEQATGGSGIMTTTIKGWSASGGGNNDFTLTLPKASGTITTNEYISDYIQANPTSTGTTSLTKLKVGSTVYNLSSGSGDVTAAGNNTFSGTNTFSNTVTFNMPAAPFKATQDGKLACTNGLELDFSQSTIKFRDSARAVHGTIVQADASVHSGSTDVTLTLPKKTGTIVADSTDNVFTGTNTFKSNNFIYSTVDPTYVEVKQLGDGTGNYTFSVASTKLTKNSLVIQNGDENNYIKYGRSSIQYKNGSSSSVVTLKIPYSSTTPPVTTLTIATLEGDQTFKGDNTFTGEQTFEQAVYFQITPQVNSEVGLEICPAGSTHKAEINIDADTLSDGNIALEIVGGGYIATQQWVTALFSYANNTLTINV